MFQSNVVTARRSPLMGALKIAAPAMALAFGLATASVSQATTYVLQNGVMEGYRVLNIAGVGNVKATPVQFDGYIDDVVDTPFTNLVAFCVDVYHRISLGDYNPDLTYTDTVDLTTDSNFINPKVLTNTEILHIGRLVNYGTNVFYNASKATNALRTARFDELAAVQGAIWEVVSGKNVSYVSGGGMNLNARITALSGAGYNSAFNAAYGFVYSDIDLLTPFKGSKVYPHRDLTQSFAIAAIPEPATWVMMIGGFGVAGAMMRRRRAQAAAA